VLAGSRVAWMRSRIMVVGRDVRQRAHLARLLHGGGYRVEIAESAAHACRIGFEGIALAIVAPDGLGPEARRFIQDLRATVGSVLLVAAPASKSERRSDLVDVSDEAGTLARVAKALAPAPEPEAAEPVLEFAGYRLDRGGHALLDQTGNEVPLTHGEFGLLRVFVQRAGRVLSRDQLLLLLSGRDADAYDRSIDMQIVRLRRKIEPDPKHPTLIVTIPNSGYKFAAKVRQAETTTLPEPEPEPKPAAATVADSGRRYVTALAAEMLAAGGTNLPGDPEELRSLIAAYRRYAAAIVARHGGMMAESRVREVLAYFGYPVAQEHAAERALRAALALAEHLPEAEVALPAALAIRIGVASGLVVADPSGELLGAAPGEAARLQDLAEPDQVIVGASTRQLAGDMFAWRDLGPLRVKGLAGQVRAWHVLGPSAIASRSEALYAAAMTPLVGREEELSTLLHAWRKARSGEGRLVLLSGEPGIGKSRLLAALEAELAGEPHASLRYFCSPLHQDSALHPIVARWEQEAGFARGDSPEVRLRKLEAIVGSADLAPEDVSLIAAMLSVATDDRYLQLELNPQRRKERTFDALLRRLDRVTRSHPVLILFEDAQWSDPSSLELLDALIGRLAELPILLVISFRGEFTAPWVGRAGASVIVLSRLNRRHSETLAAHVTAQRVLTHELLERIVTQTDGVPLFIEELTKAVLETSADPDADTQPLAVPGTLQDSLMARLDLLPAGKKVAQIGAVVGRAFPQALLATAALLPEAQLAQGLDELTASGLASRRGVAPDALYTFNHALTRDVAYASLLKSRRQSCHRRIATVLEEFDDGLVRATEPELLAYHFQEGGDLGSAFAYWIAAGDVAEQHGANQEAVAHYRSAQQLMERAELCYAERARTPELLMKLGNAQIQMDGYHSEEVWQRYGHARDAALELGQEDEAAEAGIRMSPFLFGSCRHRDVMEIGDNILRGNLDRVRPETLVHLWVMMGGASCHAGEFRKSLAFSEQAIELDDKINCTHRAPWAAADPAIVARDYVEMVSRLTGDFKRSLAISEQCMAIALDRGHLFSIVWASVSRVFALGAFGRYAEAVGCADRALEICQKYGFDARIGNVLLHRGPVLFELGDEERGLADLQRGVALWRKTSGIFMLARNMTMLADYQLRANQLGQARASLAEAASLAATTEEKDHLAEIIRLRGRIWQKEGQHDKARHCYERAIARSRDQQARLFELHAARDLARLSAETDGCTGEPESLRSIVDCFPPDLDIPVLAECRALLQQTASG
jgi:DNA-binding response OmpR family regulator/class 3 adenylate cyclase/tetratricopeptide (TPR) repeat protein